MGECWKRKYYSATAAWNAVKMLKTRRRKGQNLKVEQRAYRCPHCGIYYLTSSQRRAWP